VIAADWDGPEVALENRAAALDPREFAAILVTGTGHAPCLTVANRHTLAAENLYADNCAYWWQWVQPIAATTDPSAAADQVTAVLGAISGARS
jgi:hypothetical protein